jgi:hypothetical protein
MGGLISIDVLCNTKFTNEEKLSHFYNRITYLESSHYYLYEFKLKYGIDDVADAIEKIQKYIMIWKLSKYDIVNDVLKIISSYYLKIQDQKKVCLFCYNKNYWELSHSSLECENSMYCHICNLYGSHSSNHCDSEYICACPLQSKHNYQVCPSIVDNCITRKRKANKLCQNCLNKSHTFQNCPLLQDHSSIYHSIVNHLCRRCNQIGHFGYMCTKKMMDNIDANRENNVCNRCWKKGHFKSECKNY